MSSGGWLGHTVSKAFRGVGHAVSNVVGGVTGGLFGGRYSNAQSASTPVTVDPGAAPAPTATEQAEYDVATTNQKKKRGKNSLYVTSSASGSSQGGTGINI